MTGRPASNAGVHRYRGHRDEDTHRRREICSRRSIRTEGGALRPRGKSCANTLRRPGFVLSTPPDTRRDRATGVKSLPTCLSHPLRLQKPLISPEDDPISHGMLHNVHSDYTSVCLSWGHFTKTVFPKWAHSRHWLWRTCFSNQSIKANEIFRADFLKSQTEQRKVCHPFPQEVSNSIYMETPFKNNMAHPNPP